MPKNSQPSSFIESTAKAYLRQRNLFDPKSSLPYRLSRTKLENFLACARCFYLDRRLGLEPPGIPSFTLNSAVDFLLKKEFDKFRKKRQPHPLMKAHGIEAVPFAHPMLDDWRDNFKGVRYHDRNNNLILFGAIDDLWINEKGELIVVDYKATSTDGPISLDSEYRQVYKRQMEIYQWLLRKQNLLVSEIGYFVYCNGDRTKEIFDARLDFKIEIMAYHGNDHWVEGVVASAYHCLRQESLPDFSDNCEYCLYRKAAGILEIPLKASKLKPPNNLVHSSTMQPELF